ncbi:MAG: AAA family ATPase [Proteobacteria bacterium]|nr:AAA family ATPase [Pseudomonadota bacterium]
MAGTIGEYGVGDRRLMWRLDPLRQASLVNDDAVAGGRVELGPAHWVLLALVLWRHPFPRDELLQLLWPGAPAAGARNNLKQRVFQLHRRMARARLVLLGDILKPGPDLGGFLLPDEAAWAKDPERSAGPFLVGPDIGDAPKLREAIDAVRAHLQAARIRALRGFLEEASRRGDAWQALVYSAHLLELDPCSDVAVRRRMQLLYAEGRVPEALDAYRAFEGRLLRETLGEAEAETRALAAEIEAALRAGSRVPGSRLSVSLLRPPLFVGRGTELRRLRMACSARRVAVILGDLGIGKSRLVQESLATETRALFIKIRPGETGIPFGALSRLVREARDKAPGIGIEAWRSQLAKILPEVGVPAPDQGPVGVHLLWQALRGYFAAVGAAAVTTAIVVEDLHFGDDGTLDALEQLLGYDAGDTIAWVVTSRHPEPGSRAEALVASLVRSSFADVMALQALGVDEVVELMGAMDLGRLPVRSLAAQLQRRVGGNPLFLLEALKYLAEDAALPKDPADLTIHVPPTALALAQARLSRLSARAQQVAQVAAVADIDFTAALLEAVLDRSLLDLSAAAGELERAGIMRGTEFTSDLMQEAAERSIPSLVLPEFHRRVASALHPSGCPPARLAHHWREAGASIEAGKCFHEAAVAAWRAARGSEASEMFANAASCFEVCGERALQFQSRQQRIATLRHSDDLAHALRDAQSLLELAESDEERALACLSLARVRMDLGDPRAALASLAGTERLVYGCSNESLRFDFEMHMSNALIYTGEWDEARRHLVRAREWLDTDADDTAQRRMTYHAALATLKQFTGPVEDAEENLRTACILALEAQDLAMLHLLRNNLAQVLLRRGKASEALPLARSMRTLGDELGMGGTARIVGTVTLGAACLASGHYIEGLRTLEPLLQESEPASVWHETARTVLATIWIRLSQPAKAQHLLRVADDALAGHPALKAQRTFTRIELALAQDRNPDRDAIAFALRDAETSKQPNLVVSLHWHCRAALGDRTSSASFERICADALESGFDAAAALGQTMLAAWALSEGNPQASAQHAKTAMKVWPDIDIITVYKPAVYLELYRVFAALGDLSSATRVLGLAMGWLRSRALPDLPEPLRARFLGAHSTNRALRRLATDA